MESIDTFSMSRPSNGSIVDVITFAEHITSVIGEIFYYKVYHSNYSLLVVSVTYGCHF